MNLGADQHRVPQGHFVVDPAVFRAHTRTVRDLRAALVRYGLFLPSESSGIHNKTWLLAIS